MNLQTFTYWLFVFGFGGYVILVGVSFGDWKHPVALAYGSAGLLGLLFAWAGGMF